MTDGRTDGQTDRQTDRRGRKNPLVSNLLTAGDTKTANSSTILVLFLSKDTSVYLIKLILIAFLLKNTIISLEYFQSAPNSVVLIVYICDVSNIGINKPYNK